MMVGLQMHICITWSGWFNWLLWSNPTNSIWDHPDLKVSAECYSIWGLTPLGQRSKCLQQKLAICIIITNIIHNPRYLLRLVSCAPSSYCCFHDYPLILVNDESIHSHPVSTGPPNGKPNHLTVITYWLLHGASLPRMSRQGMGIRQPSYTKIIMNWNRRYAAFYFWYSLI